MRNSSGSVRESTPAPLQVGQARCTFPAPPQRGHWMLNFMRPPICVTWPVPWHSGHSTGPPVVPRPLQVGQASWRWISRRVMPPRTAVQKSTLTRYSRSVPGCGPREGYAACFIAAEHSTEDVTKAAAEACAGLTFFGRRSGSGITAKAGKVEAGEVKGDFLGVASRGTALPATATAESTAAIATARGRLCRGRIDAVRVEAELVEDLPLFFVTENLVCFGDLLELFLGLFVSRIQRQDDTFWRPSETPFGFHPRSLFS